MPNGVPDLSPAFRAHLLVLRRPRPPAWTGGRGGDTALYSKIYWKTKGIVEPVPQNGFTTTRTTMPIISNVGTSLASR